MKFNVMGVIKLTTISGTSNVHTFCCDIVASYTILRIDRRHKKSCLFLENKFENAFWFVVEQIFPRTREHPFQSKERNIRTVYGTEKLRSVKRNTKIAR